MTTAGDVVRKFYEAVKKKDFATARQFIHPNLVFHGLFETYDGPDSYLTALTGLMGITSRLDVNAIIAEGDQAAIFFELETTAPAAATTFVAEWVRLKDAKIHRVRSAFDGRPFEALFTSGR